MKQVFCKIRRNKIVAVAAILAAAVLVAAPGIGVAEDKVSSAQQESSRAKDIGLMKSETVYAKLGYSGEAEDVTVVTWMHADEGLPAALTDPVEVTEPRALTGAFRVASNEGRVSITGIPAGSKDIFYSGRTNKELPVAFHVTYYLDGKEVSPVDLAGKSGKVEIHIQVENRLGENTTISGRTEQVYTPLMTMVSMELPIEKFSDVVCDGGAITVVGETQKVSWMLFPYPQAEACVTMRAEDFAMDPVSIVVQPQMPPLQDLKIADRLTQLDDGLGQVDEALSKIQQGSAELAAGQDKITQGIRQAHSGSSQLVLLSRAEQKLAEAALAINQKMIAALQPYADNPVAGDMVKTLLAGLSKQGEILSALVQGGEVNGQTVPSMAVAGDKLEELTNGLSSLEKGSAAAAQGAGQIADGISAVRTQGIDTIRQSVKEALVEAQVGEAEKGLLQDKADQYDTFLGKPEGARGKVQFVIQTEEIGR